MKIVLLELWVRLVEQVQVQGIETQSRVFSE